MEYMTTALANTLMGMGTVFVMLIFISLLISLFVYIPKLEEKIKNAGKKPEPVQEITKEQKQPVVEVSQEEDEQLIAVITAAIMSSAKDVTSEDKLVVRSIHRVGGRRA